MTDHHDEADSADASFNRRNVLRMSAATAAFTGIGVPAVSAERPAGFDEVTGAEATRLYERLRETDEFERLERAVLERGGSLGDDITAGTVTGDERLELVSVPITDADADEAHLTIGRSLDSQRVTIASLEYVEKSFDRSPADVDSVDDVEGTITARVVDGLDGMEESVHEIQFDADESVFESTDAVAPAFDIGCSGCKLAVTQICQIGCGASTAFICGVLSGLGIIAGGACFTFTQAACTAIAAIGCDSPAEDICSHPQLGLC
ncbi:halocin C8-like domain-containing protein [Halopiger goleimassiliensis]|uniref:halocin C8-like domain-containing protein n=1 Tax=Halopiger goleimassiliensis TaxID=1293048 RepID=UPI000677EC0D|nr:halocin C8-like domain-containing protein [Halopiger goleimassiliensis]